MGRKVSGHFGDSCLNSRGNSSVLHANSLLTGTGNSSRRNSEFIPRNREFHNNIVKINIVKTVSGNAILTRPPDLG
jgi:hypothetical protein